MCKYLESFNPVWRTDLVSVGLATPRYLHLMWYKNQGKLCVLERKKIIQHPDEVGGCSPGWHHDSLCNVSPFNRFLVLKERHMTMSSWCAQKVFAAFIHWCPPSTCFRLAFQQEKGGWYAISGVKRNASVSPDSQKLPLLARRKLVNIGNAVFSRRHFLCQLESSFEADSNKKSQSRSVRLSSWIPTDH